MSENNVASLVPAKTDRDIADELKTKLEEVYKPVCDILNYADANGFMCNVGVAKNAFGKFQIQHLQILKQY